MKEQRRRPGRGMPFRNSSGAGKSGALNATVRALLVLVLVASAVGGLVIYFVVSRGLSAHDQPSRVEEVLARAMRRWATPQAMRTRSNPVQPTDEVIGAALGHWADHCATCHANDGSGDTGIGRGLYHSHSGFQEQRGLYGPLVIEAREPAPFKYDREHVVMLTDWTDESPERVFAKLKKRSDYYNLQQRTVGDFFRDVRSQGMKNALADRKMWGEMRMNPTDLADVSGYTYTYLLNGVAPTGNWTGLFKPGERVRLRFINGSAMSYFDVRIPGLKMTVVAADGQYVHPVTIDEFRMATAETYDVIVEPSGQDAFTIFAQSMDRTSFAAGTLAMRGGLRAAVPELDPSPDNSRRGRFR